MADVIDVLNTMAAVIGQTIYPNGSAQPSVTGLNTIIYAGWPQASQLDADMAGFSSGKGGRVHITVYPTGSEKNTTRYPTDWQPLTNQAPTVVLTITGQTVTLSGTVSTPQNVALIVSGVPYVYAIQASDTLTTIATALAALVPGASNTGPVITMTSTSLIQAARAGGTGTAFREIRRQVRTLQLTVWADTPAHRDATASALDVALAATEFVTLPDQTSARIIYQSSNLNDMTQKANLYRRDLLYTAEYATTQVQTQTGIIVTQENLHTGVSGSAATTTNQTTYQ